MFESLKVKEQYEWGRFAEFVIVDSSTQEREHKGTYESYYRTDEELEQAIGATKQYLANKKFVDESTLEVQILQNYDRNS